MYLNAHKQAYRGRSNNSPKLIRGVAEYATDQENKLLPPKELKLGMDWLEFHTPPYSGGLVDQPAGLIPKIRTAINVYRSITQYNDALGSGKIDTWINNNLDTYQIAAKAMALMGTNNNGK